MRWLGVVGLLLVGALAFWYLQAPEAPRRAPERATAERKHEPKLEPVPPPRERHRIVDDNAAPLRGRIIEVFEDGRWISIGRSDAQGWVDVPEGATWRTRAEGSSPPPSGPTAPPLTILVQGPDEQPVAGARVLLRYASFHERAEGRQDVDPELQRVRVSGKDGRARFDGLPLASMTISGRVVHPDYGPGVFSIQADGKPPTEFLAKLQPGALVSGRVLDRDGAPVPGATVTAGYQSGTSDAEGVYRLRIGFFPSVFVIAFKDGVGMGELGIDAGGQGSSVWLSSTDAAEYAEGADIPLHPVSRLRGTVREAELFQVEYLGSGNRPRSTTVVGRDGRFESDPFFVTKETQLRITVSASGARDEEATVLVKPGQDAEVGPFELRRDAQVAGLVVGVTSGVVQMANCRAIVDSEGRFVLDAVPEGRWSATYYTVEEPSRARALGKVIDVGVAEEIDGYEITVAEFGVLVGRAENTRGEPLADYQIGVAPIGVPSRIDVRKWGQFVTDEEGRFRVERLAAGRYQVAVVSELSGERFAQFELGWFMEPVVVEIGDGEVEVTLRKFESGTLKVEVDQEAQLEFAWADEPIREGPARLWLSRDSRLNMNPQAYFAQSYTRRGGFLIASLESKGFAPIHFKARRVKDGDEDIDLGKVAFSRGRSVTVRLQNQAVSAMAYLCPYPDQEFLQHGAAASFENGVARFDRVPHARAKLSVKAPGFAPVAVLLPPAGDIDETILLSRGRELELATKADLVMMRIEDGALLGVPLEVRRVQIPTDALAIYVGSYPKSLRRTVIPAGTEDVVLDLESIR
ncbi:MAG: carboxypeptidase-like regulatory domain-containing protein [Myxococcota bacterium]